MQYFLISSVQKYYLLEHFKDILKAKYEIRDTKVCFNKLHHGNIQLRVDLLIQKVLRCDYLLCSQAMLPIQL